MVGTILLFRRRIDSGRKMSDSTLIHKFFSFIFLKIINEMRKGKMFVFRR